VTAAMLGPDPEVVKALNHPTRQQILAELRDRAPAPASPSELAGVLGEGLSQVSYHVKILRELGVLKLVRTEPRRGAVEHYYCETGKATDRLDVVDLARLRSPIRRVLLTALEERDERLSDGPPATLCHPDEEALLPRMIEALS
jgi:DNA-binding transcriptional ArsR family regulator